ncbi:MAG: epoxyqueuosine reductase QueH [Lachnospiraceae bacterium]|nr:epoxyqueuosine reductase QueH [Lachnospiraceae bacterium]
MNKINYQIEFEKIVDRLQRDGSTPSLLLHSCCAPCSSYCIETLSEYFHVTVFYYNPNIYPDEEYFHRVKEQENFIKRFAAKHPVKFIEGDFEKDRFYAEVAKGLEHEPERGKRCLKCYDLRLRETAKRAKLEGMDYFCTTLSISPMKDSQVLNQIGEEIGKEIGIPYLPSDFKKKNGYLRSCEISKEYDMYRQDYCGCVFSLREREENR